MSNQFAKYVCWTAKNSHETIFVDAASPSPAVFLATHQPMLLLRRPLRGTGGSTLVTEEEMLTDFLRPDEKMMFLPIIGGSGTGKSHLVRWINMRLDSTPDVKRRVVYVPKHGTSLRRVIELILDQMEGESADRLRDALTEATSKLDEKSAPSAVLNALADCVEYQTPRPTQDPLRDQRRQEIATWLPALLRDPYFREQHFLRPNSTIRGFVDRALRGHRPGDEEQSFEFTAIELEDVTRLRSNDASLAARNAQTNLRTEPSRSLAAGLLTENLGPAIQSVFGLEGAVSLTDVMLKTRTLLAEKGEELFLLIEDFTMLQGIQRELLDAIVEPPDRSGEAPLCGIRVTLAVTAGYWDQMAETVRTRAAFASNMYDLNIPLEAELGENDLAFGLVSGYLNAARLGRQAIDDAQTPGPPETWVPNRCDTCSFKDECFDAFGEYNGKGLYPFNALALERTINAVTDADYIDPRAILGSVVKYTLEQEIDSIERGLFPSAEYQAIFTTTDRYQDELPVDVVLDIQDQPDPERRIALLTIWGGCPNQLVNLDPGIHKAFALPMLDVQSIDTDRQARPPQTEPAPTSRPVRDPLQQRLAQDLTQINAWAAGKAPLDDGIARGIRRHLADALWASVDWDVELIRRDASSRDRLIGQASFHIEDSAGGRSPGKGMWSTSVTRTPTTALLVSGIHQFDALGHWNFAGGPRALAIRSNLLSDWSPLLLDHVRAEAAVFDPNILKSVVRALALDAAILGIPGSDSVEPVPVLNAALTQVGTSHSTPGNLMQWTLQRSDELAAFARQSFERHDDHVARITANYAGRQGGGGVQALDTSKVLPPLRKFIHQAPVSDDLLVALKKELRLIRKTAKEVAELIGVSRDAREIAQEIRAAAETAGELRVFYPSSDLPTFISQTRDAMTFDLELVDIALDRTARDDSADLRSQIVWIASQPRQQLHHYLTFYEGAAKRLASALQRTQQANTSEKGEEAKRALSEALTKLATTLELRGQ